MDRSQGKVKYGLDIQIKNYTFLINVTVDIYKVNALH